MNNKKLLFAILTGFLVLPDVSPAAIDDAGMKYISASEGLSGSVRVRLLENMTTTTGDRPEVGFDTTRIIYNGESDLGGGLTATYFVEFRPENGKSALGTEYLDAGLKGPFGHIRVGSIESVSEAIVPSADRTNDVGNTGRQFSEDYNSGIRWISPNIGGLMLGVSGETDTPNTALNNQESFDQYDVAFVYLLPQGVNLGASYSIRPHLGNRTSDRDNKSAVRVGATYTRNKWGIGYNFHRHKADTRVTFNESFRVGEARVLDIDNLKDTEYVEHVVGANFSVGKFSFGLGFSKAALENSAHDIDSSDDAHQPFEVELETSMADIAYTLGSRAKLIAAYEQRRIDGESITAPDPKLRTRKEYYLLYRIDF